MNDLESMNDVEVGKTLNNLLRILQVENPTARVIGTMVDLGYVKNSNYPFSIWFVFPKSSHTIFVVKGSTQACRQYIKDTYGPSFCHKLVFNVERRTKKRNITAEIVGLRKEFIPSISFVNISRHKRRFHKHRWKISIVASPSGKVVLEQVLKRLPKTWPKELDEFV